MAVGVAVVLLGLLVAVVPALDATDVRVPAPPSARAGVVPEQSFAGRELGASAPLSVGIPAIGVRTSLIRLELNPDGTVQVPSLETRDGAETAAWYDGSPSPGERGPSVLLGHVDSARFGPAVFHDLAELATGDRVDVPRADGQTAVFRVTAVARYAKSDFPDAAVYGDIDHAGLRLITCGGEFDRARGSYEDNVVVFADLADVEPTR